MREKYGVPLAARIGLASGRPVGTFDNSPAIHRWVPGSKTRIQSRRDG